MSNRAIKNSKEYFRVIREYWSCKVNNHIRDVTSQKDKLTDKFPAVSENIATLRTLIVNVFLELRLENMIALLE